MVHINSITKLAHLVCLSVIQEITRPVWHESLLCSRYPVMATSQILQASLFIQPLYLSLANECHNSYSSIQFDLSSSISASCWPSVHQGSNFRMLIERLGENQGALAQRHTCSKDCVQWWLLVDFCSLHISPQKRFRAPTMAKISGSWSVHKQISMLSMQLNPRLACTW